MAILHTVNKSPFEKNSLDTCLAYAQDGSSVLLYEDGVYAAMDGTSAADKLKAAGGVKVFVMGTDLNARGIAEDKLIDGIELTDYAGFVKLVTDSDAVQAWI